MIMKKFYLTMMIVAAALMGLTSQAAVYLVGNIPFGNWDLTNAPEMTTTDGVIYTYNAQADAGTWVAILDGEPNWNSQRGPASGNGSAPTGDWENTVLGGNNAWCLNATGNYTFEYNTESKQVKIAVTDPTVPEEAYYLTGEFNEWGEGVAFNKADGVFTLTKTFSGEFKIRNASGAWLSATSPTEEAPSVTLSANHADNMNLPVESEYTLTIANGELTVTGWPVAPADELLGVVLKGSTDPQWADVVTLPLTQVDGGEWILQDQAIEAGFEFKVVKNMSVSGEVWLGAANSDGNFWVTEERLGDDIALTNADGSPNLYFERAGTFTFTVAADCSTLRVNGEFDAQTETLAGTVYDDQDNPLEGVTVTANPVGATGVRMRRAPGDELTTTTAADGTFTLVVPAGDYTVTFSKDGYESQTLEKTDIVSVVMTPISVGVDSVNAGKTAAAVRYVNMAGQASDKPFDGLNIVVTTYTDGSRSATKVVK